MTKLFSSFSVAVGLLLVRSTGAQLLDDGTSTATTTNGDEFLTSTTTSSLPPQIAAGGRLEEFCTFCDSTDSFDSSLSFAGITCDQWALMAMFAPPDDEQCFVLRAAAVQFCGCPTQVQETCDLCPNGNLDGYDPNQSLLFLPRMTCQDIVGMPAVDGDDTCGFMERFSYLCGCPGVIPKCSLCDRDDTTGLPLPMARPGAILVEGSPSEGVPHTTCAQWDKLLSLETSDSTTGDAFAMVDRESSTGAGSTSITLGCENSKKRSETTTGMQLDGICGCPTVEPANECKPCKEVGFVLSTNKTDCEQIAFMAPFVTNSSQCELVERAATQLGCCVEGTNEEEEDGSSQQNNATYSEESSAYGIRCSFGVIMTVFGFSLLGLFD